MLAHVTQIPTQLSLMGEMTGLYLCRYLIVGTRLNRQYRGNIDAYVRQLSPGSVVRSSGDILIENALQAYPALHHEVLLTGSQAEMLHGVNLLIAFPGKGARGHVQTMIKYAEQVGIPVVIVRE